MNLHFIASGDVSVELLVCEPDWHYPLKGQIFPTVILGGVMLIMLSIGPKVHDLNPAEGDRFLRAIEIRSTPSFRGEVKLLAPCYKILQHVKYPFRV
jgi:hypothetical protein